MTTSADRHHLLAHPPPAHSPHVIETVEIPRGIRADVTAAVTSKLRQWRSRKLAPR